MQRVVENLLQDEGRAIVSILDTVKVRPVKAGVGSYVFQLENNVSEYLRQNASVEWGRHLSPVLEDVLKVQGSVSGDALGIVYDVRDPTANRFIGEQMNLLTKNVSQTTKDAISAQIREGYANGESLDEIAGRIRRYYGDNSTSRALVTARTETLSAANEGAIVAYGQAGCKEWEWVASEDERTCERCMSHDGQHYSVASRFEIEHPQCRCCALPVIGNVA